VRTRIALIGATITLALALVAAGLAYVILQKTVTVTVDGESTTVETFAGDVGEVLDSEGIEIGERDVVAPGVDAEISEGAEISVRYGRELTVTTDGVERTYWTTATSVDSALNQLGLRVVDSAELSVSRSATIGREGLELNVVTPKRVIAVVGGDKQRLRTTAATVNEVLAELDVVVRRQDELAPRGRATVVDGLRVVVTRIGVRLKKVTVATSFGRSCARTTTCTSTRWTSPAREAGRDPPDLPGGERERQGTQPQARRHRGVAQAGCRDRAARHQGLPRAEA
jgi:uncharacterized protein YabE (DUF348 family)